jgi:hypothetical protein
MIIDRVPEQKFYLETIGVRGQKPFRGGQLAAETWGSVFASAAAEDIEVIERELYNSKIVYGLAKIKIQGMPCCWSIKS